MAAEADRLVEAASRVGDAVDDRLPAALLVQAAQSEGADGAAETLAAELLPYAHGLELADAVLVVRPDQAVRREAPVRRFDDAVE